jgi:DNA polymerase V
MLALVDCNSCFASCEAIFRPEIRHQAIVVVSNNDGCIVARNTYAKQLDIPDLVPFFKVRSYLEKNNVQVFSSNYELYGDISARIMSLLSNYCSDMETYSIDEAFLDLTGFNDHLKIGFQIKNEVWRQQRMPVCVGIAPTKTLAKLANHLAKKSQKLKGVCLLDRVNDWENVFKKIPVAKVWGIGSRISLRLKAWGIETVQELRTQPPKRIRKEFGVMLERTVRELNGEQCFEIETQPSPKKEIICSRSFGVKVSTLSELKESVASYAARAAGKLRKQNGLAQCIYVMIQTSRFNQNTYINSASLRFPYATNDSRVIVKFALELCERLYKPDYQYAKAGVGLSELSNSEYSQFDLFQVGQESKSFELMAMVDKINKRYGTGRLFLAAQGTNQRWQMVRRYKSPAYTTRFSDIPIIKI